MKPIAQETRQTILPNGLLNLTITASAFPLDEIIEIAARENSKRDFLFISKVLGKHWPSRPNGMRAIQNYLAKQIPENIPGPILFIGMAETATGLGHGVFQAHHSSLCPSQSLFIHTTRYRVGDQPVVEFYEPHSHAPRHLLHVPREKNLRSLFHDARSLVLIDDEITTCRTLQNLVAGLVTVCPSIENIHLAVIADFLDPPARTVLSDMFGVPVSVGAALTGQYVFTRTSFTNQPRLAAQCFQNARADEASINFGRLGISSPMTPSVHVLERLLNQIGREETVLVLGTGEFMHPALQMAEVLEASGIEVRVQATTRSPIQLGGGATQMIQLYDNYGEGIPNYLYNVVRGQYHHVLICHETPVNTALHDLAKRLNGRLFEFRSENDIEEAFVC